MLFLSKKIAKICDIQKLKPNPWQLKIFQLLIIQPLMKFSGPWDLKNLINDKKYEKLQVVKKC